MKKVVVVAAVAATLLATPAQAMSVREVLDTAAAIPRNPTAFLRSDTRRLFNEVNNGFATVRSEQAAARRAGRRPASCMPGNVSLSSQRLLARLNAIPSARRDISVTQALREWVADLYPCPD